MKAKTADVLGTAIVQMPERAYPGIVVQGDTWYSMKQRAERALAKAEELMPEDTDELYDLRHVVEWLDGMLRHYETTLAVHDLSLPYPKV